MDIEVIPAGVPRTSMDEEGIRWPESVVLRGEAKEIWQWTGEYSKERKDDCGERMVDVYGF